MYVSALRAVKLYERKKRCEAKLVRKRVNLGCIVAQLNAMALLVRVALLRPTLLVDTLDCIEIVSTMD